MTVDSDWKLNCGHSGGLFFYYNTEILKQILISKFGHKIQPRNSSKDYETLKIYLDIYIFQKKKNSSRLTRFIYGHNFCYCVVIRQIVVLLQRPVDGRNNT